MSHAMSEELHCGVHYLELRYPQITVSSQRSPETVSDTLVRCLACIDIGP